MIDRTTALIIIVGACMLLCLFVFVVLYIIHLQRKAKLMKSIAVLNMNQSIQKVMKDDKDLKQKAKKEKNTNE